MNLLSPPTAIEPFRIDVPEDRLTDLRARLAITRWPDALDGAGWAYGTDRDELADLVRAWAEDYDWRRHEARLNALPQFRTEIDGLRIHFVHVRGESARPMPLLLLHGWPSTFVQMMRILPLLAEAGEDSFDVIIPSLPGYGFSDRPTQPGWSVGRIAAAFAELMTRLGYDRYAVRSSDIGAGVAMALPAQAVIGQHMSGTNPYLSDVPDDLTEEEQAFVRNLRRWVDEEFAYARLHSTKPQTLAYALNDSPAGLAAWVVEKFRAWSDCAGDVESVWPRDDLLTNLTIYWVTETIGSSMRLYAESARAMAAQASTGEDWATSGGWTPPPTAIAMFPKDMVPTPRSFAERQWPVDRWTDMPSGGHFGEWEEPQLLADDIRDFFRPLRT